MPVEWYGAHVITSFRTKDKKRKWINVWETICLVKGRTPAEARKKAEKLGRFEAENFKDFTTPNGKPIWMKYEGIRKLMLIANPYPIDTSGERPIDGTDITYSEFGVRNQTELRKLVRGKQVAVEYYDTSPPPVQKKKRKRKT